MTLGLRACAKELSISHVRLLALAKEKRVPRNEDGSFDVEAVRAAFERTKDPAQRSRMNQPSTAPIVNASPEPPVPALAEPAKLDLFEEPAPVHTSATAEAPDEGFNAVRTQHERVKLQLAEIELGQRHRRLVPVEDVERQARETGRQVREGMLAIPDRVASLVAAENDAGKVHDILAGEIRKALVAVSDEIVSIQ